MTILEKIASARTRLMEERKTIAIQRAQLRKAVKTKTDRDFLMEQFKASGNRKYVFSTANNTPLDNGNVTKRVWYPLLSYLGLTKRRPYQTRHTTATLWLASGESPEWIARQMGHSTTTMLFRVYSRFVPNLTRTDGSAFEYLLKQKLTEEKV